jgi:16S rRNA (guanine527-N7)-methyltransferase
MQPEEFQTVFNVSRETLERLKTYEALLHKWQKAINLVSPESLKDSWQRHFADSAQLADLIPKNARVADLGSGAGFPGLVLAMLRPDLEIHLMESDGRKCEFLKNVSRETQTRITVHNDRVEKIAESIRPDVITARAFAPLKDILALTESVAAQNAHLMYVLLKGRGAEEEVEEALKTYDFTNEYRPSSTEKDARILTITNLQKKN